MTPASIIITPIVVGIAECAVSADPGAILVTYALGSCIAVTAYDPAARVAGLLHFMLPDSSLDSARGKDNPFLYADTGIPALLDRCIKLGAGRQRMLVRVAGGAQVLDDKGFFNIGKRNHVSMRKVMWKAGVLVHAEAVGGSLSRSVRLEVGSGKCWVRTGNGPGEELIANSGRGAASWDYGC